MPIINSQTKKNKDHFKIDIDSEVSQEIKNYMEWAGINDLSFFIEEAATLVFSKDKEWRNHKKESQKISS